MSLKETLTELDELVPAVPKQVAEVVEGAGRYKEDVEQLLETYLAIPSWEKGPWAIEMAQAAAPLAARLGATAFGGNYAALPG